jgi:hypothetical protein
MICRVRAEGIATGSAFARRGEICGRVGMWLAGVVEVEAVVFDVVVSVGVVVIADCPIALWRDSRASEASACGGDAGYLKSPGMMTIVW